MPNYCSNDLHLIHGSKEDVESLYELIGANETPPNFSFEAVVPPPDYVKAEREHNESIKTMSDAEYEWRINEWGTKWEPARVKLQTESFYGLSFETAWCPPVPVIAELHRRFPNITFYLEYFERGAQYCGGMTFLAKDLAYDDWNPGEPSSQWECNHYCGPRGG